LDATPAGGEIRIRGGAISPDRVSFSVADDGCGIRPEHLERVFEPFFTTKEPGKGTGLGLAIARNVLVEHGGAIRIQSQQGCGAAVTVELPLAEAAALERRAAS
jgi:signal transduction histidine kinase